MENVNQMIQENVEVLNGIKRRKPPNWVQDATHAFAYNTLQGSVARRLEAQIASMLKNRLFIHIKEV